MLRFLYQSVRSCHWHGVGTQNPLSCHRNLYNLTGLEWSYERDRMIEEKAKPYIDAYVAKKNTDLKTADLTEEQQKRLEILKTDLEIAIAKGRLKVASVDEISGYDMMTMLNKNLWKSGFIKYINKKYQHKTTEKSIEHPPVTDNTETSMDMKGNEEHSKEPKSAKIYTDEFVTRRSEKKLYRLRSIYAKAFASPLIIDLGFDSQMHDRESTSLCNQVMNIYGANLRHPDPYHIVFANARVNERFALHILSYMGISNITVDWTEDCFTSMYPKEKLVYLTSDADITLMEYNPEDIYVVGGLVDRNLKKLTKEKAKALGIRSARLPFDEYLRVYGRKSLNVDIVVNILLEMKKHRNWAKAFKSIPKRFLTPHVEWSRKDRPFAVSRL